MLLAALAGRAQVTNLTVNTTVNTNIPDGSAVGVTSSANVSGMFGHITNVTVTLDITGGFNGDLYCYLLAPNSSMIVLLNRVGMGSSNPFGYSNAGFNITLAAAGYNIHDYNNNSPSFSSGRLIGTWAPDRRIIDPDSIASPFDAAPTGNNFDSLNGLNPNGEWTLFIADLSGDNQSTLVSWGLTVVTVPEPQTWALLGGGLVALGWTLRNRRR